MTSDQNVIKTKVGLLELARQLGNVADGAASWVTAAIAIDSRAVRAGGETALQEISRRLPNHKNRVEARIEKAIFAMAIDQPAWSQVRVANELAKAGVSISQSGVGVVWTTPRT